MAAGPFGAETMNDSPKLQRKKSRDRRLSAALRDNLKRRKAQAKERSAASDRAHAGGGTERSHDSAGIGRDKN